MTTPRFGPLLWILCLQYFAAEALVIAGWSGNYSLSRNFISDLGAVNCEIGAVCSPWHGLMNASFVLQGLLILGGVVLNRKRLPAGALAQAGLALLALSSFGVMVVGLAPEDTAPGWHYLGASEHFLLCNIGAMLLGFGLFGRSMPMALASVIAGGLGIAGVGLLGAKVDLGWGVGVIERLTAYPFPIWVAMMGAWLRAR